MRDKISMVHGRKAPQGKGRRDANRESEQLQKRTPIRETTVEQRIRKESKETLIRTVAWFGSVWGGFLGGILGGIARAGFSHRRVLSRTPLIIRAMDQRPE